MSYHLKDIPKGVYGQYSKVYEEMLEFLDANEQDCKIMMMCELSDIFGAYSALPFEEQAGNKHVLTFIEDSAKELNLNLNDVYIFSKITKRAFESGARK
jgi:hypothetical protein